MNDNTIAVCVAIITIGAILIVALVKDVNGAILGSGLAVIGTILGYLFGVKQKAQALPSTDETLS